MYANGWAGVLNRQCQTCDQEDVGSCEVRERILEVVQVVPVVAGPITGGSLA